MDNKKTIGGRTYAFGRIPPTEALKVEVAIAKVIGQPLFRALMDAKKTGSTNEDMERAGVQAIGLMAANMDSDLLLEVMKTVFKYTSCDAQRIVDIDETFMGRNKELWQAFIAGLQFNFSDFLPERLFSSIQDKVKKSLS